MSQMPKVNCSHGAPMGRREYGLIQNCERGTVLLFKVELDSGGYDDGGAYWGLRSVGRTLYCATDNAEYCRFVDAFSRSHAALLLNIEPEQLKRGLERVAFGRYSAVKGHFGKSQPGYEVCEFGLVLTHVDSWEDLCAFAQEKEKANVR